MEPRMQAMHGRMQSQLAVETIQCGIDLCDREWTQPVGQERVGAMRVGGPHNTGGLQHDHVADSVGRSIPAVAIGVALLSFLSLDQVGCGIHASLVNGSEQVADSRRRRCCRFVWQRARLETKGEEVWGIAGRCTWSRVEGMDSRIEHVLPVAAAVVGVLGQQVLERADGAFGLAVGLLVAGRRHDLLNVQRRTERRPEGRQEASVAVRHDRRRQAVTSKHASVEEQRGKILGSRIASRRHALDKLCQAIHNHKRSVVALVRHGQQGNVAGHRLETVGRDGQRVQRTFIETETFNKHALKTATESPFQILLASGEISKADDKVREPVLSDTAIVQVPLWMAATVPKMPASVYVCVCLSVCARMWRLQCTCPLLLLSARRPSRPESCSHTHTHTAAQHGCSTATDTASHAPCWACPPQGLSAQQPAAAASFSNAPPTAHPLDSAGAATSTLLARRPHTDTSPPSTTTTTTTTARMTQCRTRSRSRTQTPPTASSARRPAAQHRCLATLRRSCPCASVPTASRWRRGRATRRLLRGRPTASGSHQAAWTRPSGCGMRNGAWRSAIRCVDTPTASPVSLGSPCTETWHATGSPVRPRTTRSASGTPHRVACSSRLHSTRHRSCASSGAARVSSTQHRATS
ncbi:hypothetical protein BC831DRAFT_526341 [Entophlyctis helioformis]|nr:hypothetical protein BC831DRAFT_526341 [Entophlyctis helioformis]